jgi:hypothetical protein
MESMMTGDLRLSTFNTGVAAAPSSSAGSASFLGAFLDS